MSIIQGISIDAQEITITITGRKNMGYLYEAIASYEMYHINRSQKVYLPKLILELEKVCLFNYDKGLTEACEKQLQEPTP